MGDNAALDKKSFCGTMKMKSDKIGLKEKGSEKLKTVYFILLVSLSVKNRKVRCWKGEMIFKIEKQL